MDIDKKQYLSNDRTMTKKICAICHKEIEEEDLVYLMDRTNDLTVHFRCYIEVHDKICSICGKPFQDKEKLFFCEMHKEYFHTKNTCLQKHMKKHMPFKIGYYDANSNRIIIEKQTD
jgi:hypothetical protein